MEEIAIAKLLYLETWKIENPLASRARGGAVVPVWRFTVQIPIGVVGLPSDMNLKPLLKAYGID